MSKAEIAKARRRREEAVDWALRNREAELPPKEAAEFEAWCARDPANRDAYDQARRLLSDARSAMLSDSDLAASNPQPKSSSVPKAAGTLAVIGLVVGAFLAVDGPMWLQADRIAGVGETPIIQLADGSTVQLNATSAVAFELSGARRVVKLLRGEAYFQVAKDPQRPFVVEAMGGKTTALGTAFNVRLSGATADVVVTEHRVRIAAANGAAGIEVGEGQGAAYSSGGRVGAVGPRDIYADLAWRRGQLVVDNVPLATVVDQIAHHFRGRIVIMPGTASRRVSGTFTISDPQAAFALFQSSLGITVQQFGPIVFIRG
jgi:transmembrane sensor